jgi:hypothetical protein
LLLPIVEDEHLTATEKLLRVFEVAARWKTDRKEYLLTLVNVWYADNNAVLRQKAQAAVLPQITPLITPILRQGISEGVFHTAYPDQLSGIIFSVLQSFGDTLVALIVQQELTSEALQRLESLAASHQDAMERILGANPGSLPLFETSLLREWFPLSNLSKE